MRPSGANANLPATIVGLVVLGVGLFLVPLWTDKSHLRAGTEYAQPPRGDWCGALSNHGAWLLLALVPPVVGFVLTSILGKRWVIPVAVVLVAILVILYVHMASLDAYAGV
jgi:putative effector of murein hydrolase LrgA (UPF0299 family)